VVFYASDRHQYEVKIVANSGWILPMSFLAVVLDKLRALFSAEHHAQMDHRKRMCHLSPLPGLNDPSQAPTAHAVGYNISPLPGLDHEGANGDVLSRAISAMAISAVPWLTAWC